MARRRPEELFPGVRPPYYFAHRGLSKLAPENSLSAFREASLRGVPGIELDVQLTKDGRLVVYHDRRLSRRSGGTGSILDYELEALSQFSAVYRHGRFSRGEPIPTLDRVFDEFGARFYYDVEIKSQTGVEASAILEVLGRVIASRKLEKRCLVSSFSLAILEAARSALPGIPLAPIFSRRPTESIEDYVVWKPRSSLYRSLRESEIAGRHILVWTVNSHKIAHRMLDGKATGIISDVADRLL